MALSLLLWRPASRAWGWVPAPTLATLVLLSLVAAITLVPGRQPPTGGVRSCVRRAPRVLDATVSQGLSDETLLNLVMLAPLGIALVLAARRWLPVLGLLVLVPGVVEIAQTRVPGRICSGVDYATNLTGGLLGAAVGVALLQAARFVRRPSG